MDVNTKKLPFFYYRLLEMTEESNSDYLKQLLLGCLENGLSKIGLSTQYKGTAVSVCSLSSLFKL